METITFEDGSFIRIEKSPHREGYTTITMGGLSEDGNRVTMCTSDLDPEQTEKICNLLQSL